MKKFIIAIVVLAFALIMSSCTPQDIARNWGGNATIELPKGERLIEATWKDDNNIWYLTEPMPADYVPTVKYFRESSSFGVMEGTVKFVESR